MLNDPLKLGVVSVGTIVNLSGIAADSSVTLPTTSLAAGKSVRTGSWGGDNTTLTVSHSETKENAPYKTHRLLVRLDRRRVDANGVEVTCSAYGVVAYPQGSIFTVDEVEETARALFLMLGISPVDGSGNLNLLATDDTLARIIAGES